MTNDLRTIAKHWAIEPDALQNITANLKDPSSGLSLFEQRPLQNTRTATIRDGVAVIPVSGIITPRDDLFTILFGGTSLDRLARDFQAATDDPNVRAILFDIDSPGGVAVGPAEMSEIIRKCQKPVWSYVGRNCCSAAYWLASATNKILCHRSSLLGSIGVVSTIPVQETPDADGYKHIEIVSSNAKEQTTRSANFRRHRNNPCRELDALESEFISAVAKLSQLTRRHN